MKESRAQQQRFFPWAHEANGIKLAIVGGQLDAQSLDIVDPHTHVLDLSASWQRAKLALEVRVPAAVATRVVAADEREQPPLAVLIALRCASTHLRRRVAYLPWQAGASGCFEHALEIVRAELAEQAELDAYLIRSRSLNQPTAGVAWRAGARLASARAWTLQIDPSSQRGGNYLDVQYRSFARDPSIPAGQRAALYRLDFERDDAILYLNADHERVRSVLDSKATTGRRARARELLYERIEAGVWMQLILRASARLVEDGELVYAWERSILEQWLPRLYPEQVDDAARRDCLRRDYQQLPRLLTTIDAVTQVSGELATAATKLVDEL